MFVEPIKPKLKTCPDSMKEGYLKRRKNLDWITEPEAESRGRCENFQVSRHCKAIFRRLVQIRVAKKDRGFVWAYVGDEKLDLLDQ